MADYELIGLNEAAPDLRAPAAADTGVVTNLIVTGVLTSSSGVIVGSGTSPQTTPLNQYLGALAYQDVIGIFAATNVTPTIASAATIQPTAPITFISGTTNVVDITPPPSFIGGGQITLIPTGLWSTTTAGNIALATTAVVDKALIMTYDATTAKFYPSY